MNCGGMFFGNGSTCGGSPGCDGNRSYGKSHITRQTSRIGSNSCGVGYTTVSCGGGGGCSAMRERSSARFRQEEQREAERRQCEVLNQGRFPDEHEVNVRMCRNTGSCGGTSGCGGATPDVGGSCGSGGGCGSSNGCGGNNSSLVDRFNQRRRGF